jgi:tRNA-specific 2-thiouridylase
MVTLGQRRGLGVPGGGPVRYVIGVDASSDQPTVVVGDADDLLVRSQIVHSMTWVDETFEGDALAQTSAHGDPRPCHVTSIGDRQVQIDWGLRSTRIAPGQSVVLYDSTNTWVIGGGIAQHSPL